MKFDLFKLVQNVCFRMITVQGIGIYFGDSLKNIVNNGLRSDAYEPIYFKFGLTVDVTNLYILILL